MENAAPRRTGAAFSISGLGWARLGYWAGLSRGRVQLPRAQSSGTMRIAPLSADWAKCA